MDSDKYIKFFKVFVAVALVISLVINFTLLFRLDQLENQVNSVSNNQHNIINNINGQTNQIQNVLNDIKEEQSWISRINMDVNTKELEDGQAEAIFEWQVKELQSNSEVVFNYAYGDSEDYTALTAEELQQGLFQVEVPLKIVLEPQWEVGLITTNSNTNTQQVMSKKEREEEHRRNTLKYFVSVSYDDMVKSVEVHTENLGHFGTNHYGIIQTDIHIQDEKFNVTLMNHNVHDSTFVVEEAYLLQYEDEAFIGEKEIELDGQNNPPGDRDRFFHLNQVEKFEDMRLVIKVVYSNGETFEKEVY